MARTGKIARLPEEIRNELNRRLKDGEQGETLLAWLNALPQTVEVLARYFGGVPISKQNLCKWRAGGFAEWRTRRGLLREVREVAAEHKEITAATDGKLTEQLGTVLAARYAAAFVKLDGQVTDSLREELEVLRGLCREVVSLRREDHSEWRLKLEREHRDWKAAWSQT